MRSHQPVLHVDLTDGFRPQNFKLIFNYRGLSSGTQPPYTCLRYSASEHNDDQACDNAHRGAGPASLANVGPSSNVDHLDYPAKITGDCGRKAAAGQACPETALANRYWNGQPVMYFFGHRDNANQKRYDFWFYYSFNYIVLTQSLPTGDIQGEYDLHEGDLEDVIVYTDAHDKPIVYTFYRHGVPYNYRASDRRLHLQNGHLEVFAAHGSHASEIGCGLWDIPAEIFGLIGTGQRDRTCVHDPYTDNVIGSRATYAYAPTGTAISNLDTANWACFGFRDHTAGRQHRLGQSNSDIGSNFSENAPLPPLVQRGFCPNLYARQHPTAAAETSDPGVLDTGPAAKSSDRLPRTRHHGCRHQHRGAGGQRHGRSR